MPYTGLDLSLLSTKPWCRVCPYMIPALQYILRKANTLPNLKTWRGIRISYGMNGVVLCSADVPTFVSVLRRGAALKPPDLLWRDWATSREILGVRTRIASRAPLQPCARI